ncbi:hypothetical protein [Streptomyces tricolor]
MTDRTHNHRDQAVDHWLAQHQSALIDALDDVLDTEAGLREILIHSRHDTAVDGLDTVLDTEAGLAAILPPTPQLADTPKPHETPRAHTDGQELLQAFGPADRMTLRNHPAVKEASQALARGRTLNLTPELAVARARDLAHDLVRTLAHDVARARDLTRAHNFIPDLTRAHDLVRDLTRALDRTENLGLADTLNLTRELPRTLALALARARALDRVAGLPHNRTRTVARALARARNRAHDLAHTLNLVRDLEHALDPDRVLDLTRALDRTVIDVRTAEVRRAIGLALRREPPELDEDSLHSFLDDFTTADLSDADLSGMDLSGIHWSEHGTQWPPTLDVEDLKAHSDEAPPGSGTWIIRSGTATTRDLAEL